MKDKDGLIKARKVNPVESLVRLDFMVVPESLRDMAYVPDPVRCKVIDPQAIFLTGILGESGRKLVEGGIEFYFTRPLAEKLIAAGIAIESNKAARIAAGLVGPEVEQ